MVRGTWYVVRGTWGPRTEGRHHTTFPAHPRSSPTTPMAATSHRCIFPGSLSEIIDSRNSSSPALCLSQTCVGPLLLPTYQSSCKERREEERGFFVLISVCKRACKVLPGHRSKRGEYMPPSFMCSLALPAACQHWHWHCQWQASLHQDPLCCASFPAKRARLDQKVRSQPVFQNLA